VRGTDLRALRHAVGATMVSMGVELGLGGSGATVARRLRRLEGSADLPDEVAEAVRRLAGTAYVRRQLGATGEGRRLLARLLG
jgi:hypothetical protein